MKRAIVLNKGEIGELKKQVKHLRKTRDEALMELKTEKSRLQIVKKSKVREQPGYTEYRNAEDKTAGRKNSTLDSQLVKKERPKTLLPPLSNVTTKVSFGSLSEPSTPMIAPDTKLDTTLASALALKCQKVLEIDSMVFCKLGLKSKLEQTKSSSFDESVSVRNYTDYRPEPTLRKKAWRDVNVERQNCTSQTQKSNFARNDIATVSKQFQERDTVLASTTLIKSPACSKGVELPDLLDRFGNPGREGHMIDDRSCSRRFRMMPRMAFDK